MAKPVLPVEQVLPEVLEALGKEGRAVLEAPPGAGKTTLVPLALLHSPWLAGQKVIMLEPRRMATRAAAQRMASLLGESVGHSVGYRIRMESKISTHTRIEVVTEGILTRMLQDDPLLHGVGCLIFDEFHERHVHGDVGLALALDCQQGLREDLRLLVMSATLDGASLGQWLHCPVISSTGRSWPVETVYAPVHAPQGGRTRWSQPELGNRAWLEHVARTVCRAMDEHQGSVLVFLPGAGEIRRVGAMLEAMTERFVPGQHLAATAQPVFQHAPVLAQKGVVYPLYGELPADAQDAAIAPPLPGQRKVVLATAIAETSLTIEGVSIVIDGGLSRVARFDPGSGMGRLVTERVSQAGADQRRGRAGRLGPGVCYRLWSQGENAGLRDFARPEIMEADLARLLLETAVWGAPDPTALHWLDTPPDEAMAQAKSLLHALDALDKKGRVTARGQRMAMLPLHPRLAHMVLEAKSLGLTMEACLLAALAGERDVLQGGAGQGFGTSQGFGMEHGVDARLRVGLLAGEEHASQRVSLEKRRVLERMRLFARHIYEQTWGKNAPRFFYHVLPAGVDQTGILLALAYPDRVAQRRKGAEEGKGGEKSDKAQGVLGNQGARIPGQPENGTRGVFRLRNGSGATLPETDPLADAPFLAVGELEDSAHNARIRQAAPLTREELDALFASHYVQEGFVVWNAREQGVIARQQTRLGALVLDDAPLAHPCESEVRQHMLYGIRDMGLACLPWTEDALQWRARVHFVRTQSSHPAKETLWPDVSDSGLLQNLEVWLEPFLAGITRRSHLKKLDVTNALHSLLTWDEQQMLSRMAPTHVTVPSGSRVPLIYACVFDTEVTAPVLAVKLQELFGLTQNPKVDGLPVQVHLLSPAGRPLQVTCDLEGFWKNSYPAVRAEMRGRYPRHPWPEDPLTALPTRFTKKRAGL